MVVGPTCGVRARWLRATAYLMFLSACSDCKALPPAAPRKTGHSRTTLFPRSTQQTALLAPHAAPSFYPRVVKQKESLNLWSHWTREP